MLLGDIILSIKLPVKRGIDTSNEFLEYIQCLITEEKKNEESE